MDGLIDLDTRCLVINCKKRFFEREREREGKRGTLGAKLMRFNKANCRIDFSTFFLFLTSRFLFKMNRGIIILETIITYAAIRKINLLRKIARHMLSMK